LRSVYFGLLLLDGL